MVGSVLRYWGGGFLQQATQSRFPIGTLSINLLGSLLIGWVLYEVSERQSLGDDARLLLAAGFCGGFTTMSAFAYESLTLIRQGNSPAAAAYVVLTIVGCVGATWLGVWIGQQRG